MLGSYKFNSLAAKALKAVIGDKRDRQKDIFFKLLFNKKKSNKHKKESHGMGRVDVLSITDKASLHFFQKST